MKNLLNPDGALLRRLAVLGSTRGPDVLLRGAPPVLGALFWALRSQHREGVRRNLRRIYGPRPAPIERRDEIATFVAFARSLAEGMAALGPKFERVAIEVCNSDAFEEAMAAGRGIILVTAHTSSFELAGAALGKRYGLEVVLVMRPERDARARELSDLMRKQAGLRIEHVGDDPLAALPLVAHLRRGAVIAMQIDRLPPGVKGLPVTLFGDAAQVPLGPFALASATGAAIVPVFTRRTGFLAAKVQVVEPIYVEKRASREKMASQAAGVASQLEAWVREQPTEWLDWGGA